MDTGKRFFTSSLKPLPSLTTRPTRPAAKAQGIRGEAVLAMALTLVTVGILALLFRFDSGSGSATVPRGSRSKVIMLPVGNLPEYGQQSLISWMELLDPTILSLPNAEHGFSRNRVTEFERPVKTYAPEPIPHDQVALPEFSEIRFLKTLDTNPIDAADRERIVRPWALPPPRPVHRPGPAICTGIDGIVIDSVPVLAVPDAVRQAANGKEARPTRLRLTRQGRMVRVLLEKSSGITALDMLAIAHLRQWLIQDPDMAFPGEVVMHWRLYAKRRKEL